MSILPPWPEAWLLAYERRPSKQLAVLRDLTPHEEVSGPVGEGVGREGRRAAGAAGAAARPEPHGRARAAAPGEARRRTGGVRIPGGPQIVIRTVDAAVGAGGVEAGAAGVGPGR